METIGYLILALAVVGAAVYFWRSKSRGKKGGGDRPEPGRNDAE